MSLRGLISAPSLCCSRITLQKQLPAYSQVRHLSLHEYISMSLLKESGVPVPRGLLAKSPSEAAEKFKELGTSTSIIKAQVLAGGRGHGHFTSGLKGGVHVVNSPSEAKEMAEKMIGHKLITKQTGKEGRPCNSLFVVEKLDVKHEYYFAIALDRTTVGPVLIASSRGGVDIEAVAEESPECIIKHCINYKTGLTHAEALEAAKKLGFGSNTEEAAGIFERLYKFFVSKNSTMVEINPMALVQDKSGKSEVVCMDAKVSFDDNASYKHPEIFALRDTSQEDPLEVQASKWDLSYIKLDGDIGCMVNGAGLAMSTMDVIKLYGGEPANFLDIGGTAEKEKVMEAFRILSSDEGTKTIFVNIFGGIVRCDEVAEGVVSALRKLGTKVPLVMRLKGTRIKEAKKIVEESGLNLKFVDGFGEAAELAVKLSKSIAAGG